MPLLYPPLFTPSLHREIHEADGVDEINVKGLSILTSGLDADKPTPAKPGRLYWALDSGILYRDNGNQWIKIAVKDFPDLDESSHKTTHQDDGSDELSVAGLSGLLADRQNPRLIFKTSDIYYDLNVNGNWHSLDLTANTSLTAYIAFGCLIMQATLTATIYTDFRKNGLSFIQFTFGSYTSVGAYYYGFWMCELDNAQILEYKVYGCSGHLARIRLVGYME